MEDIFVRYLDMPLRIKGMTTLDAEGDYNVYVNPRYSYEMQKEILEHEKEHIKRNDFYNEMIGVKEKEDI